MTRRFRCWRQVLAKPNSVACGHMFEMIGRPAGDLAPATVWFVYSPDRKGEHPHRHLATSLGTLQADGYAGFNRLYDGGRIQEAACWAHVRRKVFDLHQAHASPIASEAISVLASSID
jgi:hypothetical protein